MPYQAWERGLNEHTNDFASIFLNHLALSRKESQFVEDHLTIGQGKC